MLQSWHYHVPLKENWPHCTAFLMESPRGWYSLGPLAGNEPKPSIYIPLHLGSGFFLQEQNLLGLLAFTLPIHLALCVVCER